MPERYAAIRDSFRESVLQVVDVVERVPPEAWEKPELGERTAHELVAHAMPSVECPVVNSRQPKAVDMYGATTYYLRAMSSPTIHEAAGDGPGGGVTGHR